MRARAYILLAALLLLVVVQVRVHGGGFERPVCHCALCSAADQAVELPTGAPDVWSSPTAFALCEAPEGSFAAPVRERDACRAPPSANPIS